MNCRDFLRHCAETLDARGSMPAPPPPPGFEAHAASCRACRSAHAGAVLLGQAFAALPPPPPASAASLARLRTLRVPAAPIPLRTGHRAATGRLAAAAAILALAAVGYSASRWRGVEDQPRPAVAAWAPPSPPIPTRPIDAAFRDATRVTIDLARAASAPAARIGREALDIDLDGPASPPAGATDLVEVVPPGGGASRLLEAVGERARAGVRPISGSARHAFSFLLGPVDEPPPAPPAGRDTL